MTRFEYQFPGLAAELQRAPIEIQRAACLAACEYAVAQSKIEQPIVLESLRKMRDGKIITDKDKHDLEALVEQLDNEYFDLAEAFDEGRIIMRNYQMLFAKARAGASVLYAFDPNPYEAASEAIYEASAVTDEADARVLITAIMAILEKKNGDMEK